MIFHRARKASPRATASRRPDHLPGSAETLIFRPRFGLRPDPQIPVAHPSLVAVGGGLKTASSVPPNPRPFDALVCRSRDGGAGAEPATERTR
jgi:hypothetical protein